MAIIEAILGDIAGSRWEVLLQKEHVVISASDLNIGKKMLEIENDKNSEGIKTIRKRFVKDS